MNTILKIKIDNEKKIFKVKLLINIIIIFVIGMNWGNVPRQSTKNVMNTSNELSSVTVDNKSEDIYNIELFSNINVDGQAASEDAAVKEESFETLLAAQEEIKVTVENDVNTFQNGTAFSVKAEEAYSFGRNEGKKYAFLTFDDGPSQNITGRVLDTLKRYDVKATFFVLGKSVEENPRMLKRELEEGHAVANHTYSHDYKKIYPKKTIDVNLFSEELEKNKEAVKHAAERDINMRVIRFPGGSFEHWKDPMKEEIKRRGMEFVDWNAENGDGLKANIPVEEQLENVRKNISWAENSNKNVVMLMHDAPAKGTTADALPKIIEYIKSRGYEFKTLK